MGNEVASVDGLATMRQLVKLTLAFVALPYCLAANETFSVRKATDGSVTDRRFHWWWPFPKDYTQSATGCPCWYDLFHAKGCACCKQGGIQCGFPQHNKCKKDDRKNTERHGCNGIPENRHTLSMAGYPCPWNPNDRTCAWCANGAKLCIRDHWASARGGICVGSWNSAQCLSIPQDCRVQPSPCDPNAECLYTGNWQRMWGRFRWHVHRCVCKPGFVGNGMQCINEATGRITPRMETKVDVNMKLTTDFFEGPAVPASAFPHGPSGNDLMKEIDDMLDQGTQVCGAGCDAAVVHCGKKNR